MKMIFSINTQNIPTKIIKKPLQESLQTRPISYDFFKTKPMLFGIHSTSNCTSCGK
jgi:hypothetical protein